MTKIMVLGASGALGKHVAQQAVDVGHDVSVVVRTPSATAAWRTESASSRYCTIRRSAGGFWRPGSVISTAGRSPTGPIVGLAHIVGGLEASSRQPSGRVVMAERLLT
jgi:NAD(P)-dependent dehydrogenase (short-subunit alcohol dehydrogenase family)